MTAGITAALLVTAVLGASFRATRHIGIAGCAALCFIYPWLSVLVIAGVLLFLFRKRSQSE
jgi:hypothetical protein